jgi:hypothetical protein
MNIKYIYMKLLIFIFQGMMEAYRWPPRGVISENEDAQHPPARQTPKP